MKKKHSTNILTRHNNLIFVQDAEVFFIEKEAKTEKYFSFTGAININHAIEIQECEYTGANSPKDVYLQISMIDESVYFIYDWSIIDFYNFYFSEPK